MREFTDVEELKTAVGQVLGESEWVTVSQEMIDRFAEATGDFQWIHVDRTRAKASPFGNTIAHGFLTLSLLPLLRGVAQSGDARFPGVRRIVNYGLNRVRFTNAVVEGSIPKSPNKKSSTSSRSRRLTRASWPA